MEEIMLIELELHALCNRKCNWCPNLEIDRTKMIWLDEAVLLELLYDLKELDYSNAISFSRYNEPFADYNKFKRRVSLIKRVLPCVRLVTNTNGDFLMGKILEDLELDELTIMDYDNKGIKKCEEHLKSLGAEVDKMDYPYIYAHFDNMTILYFVDWKTNGLIVDRGGSIDNSSMNFKANRCERKRPCFEPEKFIGIDYNGNVMPCCNLRSDNIHHTEYVLGNLHKSNIKDIIDGGKRRSFVRATGNVKSLPNPCQRCQKDSGRYTREEAGIEYD